MIGKGREDGRGRRKARRAGENETNRGDVQGRGRKLRESGIVREMSKTERDGRVTYSGEEGG